MENVACYIRVSTSEQKTHGLSVDNQLKALTEYCEQNGYNPIIYNDAGISAHVSYKRRPAMLKMINDCQNGEISLIVMTKLDRFFRSVPDYYAVVEQLNEVPWKTIWEDYETVTSAGKFKVNIMLSIAQAEAERTSERICNTFEYKRAKGDYVGSAPFGYKRENNRLVKDDNAHYVEMIFETYLRTHSMLQTEEALQLAGSTVTKSGINCVLRNETYTGNAKGTQCEPYITLEDFQRIQEIRSRNYRTPIHGRTYKFHRLIICSECGHPLRGNSVDRCGTTYMQYTCHGRNLVRHKKSISISEKKVEKYLLDNLSQLLDDYKIQAKEISADNVNNDIEAERKKLEGMLERIGIRFELGDYSVDEYKQKRIEIQQKISELPVPEAPKELVELPDNWQDVYNDLDPEHQKQFWDKIIDKIIIDTNHKLSVIFN